MHDKNDNNWNEKKKIQSIQRVSVFSLLCVNLCIACLSLKLLKTQTQANFMYFSVMVTHALKKSTRYARFFFSSVRLSLSFVHSPIKCTHISCFIDFLFLISFLAGMTTVVLSICLFVCGIRFLSNAHLHAIFHFCTQTKHYYMR